MNSIEFAQLDSDEDILSFIHNYCTFGSNRLYLMIAMARPRENDAITHNNMPIFREIITREEKIESKYYKIKTLTQNYTDENGDKLVFRFYFSTNARDVDKSTYLYQKKLLEMQRHINNGHKPTREKIKRLDQEWISMLQKAGNKEDNKFIIDIDKDDESLLKSIYTGLEEETNIIECIKTPNGFHLITEPFNPNIDILEEEYIEIKKDDLFFLSIK